MSRMQYGEFVFPHNPRRIELSYTGTLAPQVFPGCGAAASTARWAAASWM